MTIAPAAQRRSTTNAEFACRFSHDRQKFSDFSVQLLLKTEN